VRERRREVTGLGGGRDWEEVGGSREEVGGGSFYIRVFGRAGAVGCWASCWVGWTNTPSSCVDVAHDIFFSSK
jgi:hypothetical protein